MKSRLVLALALALPLIVGWAGNQGAQSSTPGSAAIAGLTGSANNVPMYTSATAAALLPISAAAQTILDDASVAAILATIGGAASATTISAGTGLTGGGSLAANRTLTLDPVISGTSLTVTDSVTATKRLSIGNSGTAQIANGSTSTVITMAQAQPDTSYHVTLASVDAVNGLPALYRITSRSTTQFTITYTITTGTTDVTYTVTDHP